MVKRDKVIPPIRVNEVEINEIKELASLSGLSLSEFVRSAALGVEINARFDLVAITNLLKINADQARLGNLLKLTLDTLYDCNDKVGIAKINNLITEISSSQQKLKIKNI